MGQVSLIPVFLMWETVNNADTYIGRYPEVCCTKWNAGCFICGSSIIHVLLYTCGGKQEKNRGGKEQRNLFICRILFYGNGNCTFDKGAGKPDESGPDTIFHIL